MIYIYKAELVRVVDGDTVELMIDLGFSQFTRQTMRLYGIDAPEMRTAEGKAAKAWLWNALQPLETIYVQTIQLSTKAKRDKYGRFLAVLYREFGDVRTKLPEKSLALESINSEMIEVGHAKERYW
jgi:micrococcal nuclease